MKKRHCWCPKKEPTFLYLQLVSKLLVENSKKLAKCESRGITVYEIRPGYRQTDRRTDRQTDSGVLVIEFRFYLKATEP